jgi:hypothetical protein
VAESECGTYEEWIRSRSPSPFVTPDWLEAFRDRHRTPVYFRLLRGGETVAAIAGLLVRPRTRRLEETPALKALFTFGGPVVGDGDPTAISACLEELRSFAVGRGIPAVVCRSWDYPYRYSCDRQWFRTDTRVEYIVDLRGGPERQMARMGRTRRACIRRAARRGLRFRLHSGTEWIPVLIGLLEETRSVRRRKGYSDYDYHYITYTSTDLLARLLRRGVARIAGVDDGEKTLAACLVVNSASRAYAVLGGQCVKGYEAGAADLLYHHVIRRLGEEGVESLNLGGNPVSGDHGLRFYKTSLGATPHTCTGARSITPRARMIRALGNLYRRFHARIR